MIKECKVADVVTYMNRPSDWISGPIVRGVVYGSKLIERTDL